MSLLTAFDFLNEGGWVAWVLALLSTVLWYALGYRYLYLRSQYLKNSSEEILRNEELNSEDLLGESINNMKFYWNSVSSDLEIALQFELKRFKQKVSSHSQTIRSIVMVAPLLGLLGTVIGMIETFDSLQDSSLFSQSGGIAGGISQALITTQMGLVVAVPGLLMGKKLDQRQNQLTDCLESMMTTLNLKEVGK